VVAVFTFIVGVAVATFFVVHKTSLLSKHERSSLPTCFPGLSVKVNKAGSDPALYFPEGVFNGNMWQNQFFADWYSQYLAAMNEPSLLFGEDGDIESYRFLWLRSFHHPVVVRLWRSGGKKFLVVKQLDGVGGERTPGTLLINKTRPISEDEWERLLYLLEQSCFWKLPTKNSSPEGEDGAQWLVEGSKEGHYHVVDRWSPKDGSYREIGIYLLKLAGFETDDVY